jgi:hypothetical protein
MEIFRLTRETAVTAMAGIVKRQTAIRLKPGGVVRRESEEAPGSV